MALTEDQSEVLKEAIYTAIQQDLEEHEEARPGLLLQELVVVASLVGFDGDGERVTQVSILPVDGANHRIMGLLEEAKIRFQADSLETYLDR